MSTHEMRQKPPVGARTEIPDKLYFRIGDVARLCDVPAYVLRFWESQFPQLRPNKSGTGQRLYRRRDVETVVYIKDLLYSHGMTIAGAKQVLKSGVRSRRVQTDLPFIPPAVEEAKVSPAKLSNVRQELRDILNILSADPVPQGGATGRRVRKTPVEFPDTKLF